MIAGKKLHDSNFNKSVVLMVEHNSEGSMGLIVNRPSTVTVSDALSEHFELPDTDALVYIGGPVEPSALFILHNRSELNGSELAVVPNLYVGNSPEIFETVVRRSPDDDPEMWFQIYCGCAGWSGGQLEDELNRGDWFLLPASANPLTQGTPYDIWDDLRSQVHRLPDIHPGEHDHPEWN